VVFEFHKINPRKFERLVDFHSNASIYDVYDWDQNLSSTSTFYEILHHLDKQCLQQRSIVNYNSIPMFLRNAHHHFKDHCKVFLIVVFFVIVNFFSQLNLLRE
jgi:hypothetical protein